jgi:hypothetical protein
LVDARTNETLVSYSGSGYSEDCPPASGNIFENISLVVANAWGSGEATSEAPVDPLAVPTQPVTPWKAETKKAPESPRDVYSELIKLDDLRKKGILTEEEFQLQKKKLLDGK